MKLKILLKGVLRTTFDEGGEKRAPDKNTVILVDIATSDTFIDDRLISGIRGILTH